MMDREIVYLNRVPLRTLFSRGTGGFESIMRKVQGMEIGVPEGSIGGAAFNPPQPQYGYPGQTVNFYMGPLGQEDLRHETLKPWPTVSLKINLDSGKITRKEYYYFDSTSPLCTPMDFFDTEIIGFTYEEDVRSLQEDHYFRIEDNLLSDVILAYGFDDPRPNNYIKGKWDTYGAAFNDGDPVRLKMYTFPASETSKLDPMGFRKNRG